MAQDEDRQFAEFLRSERTGGAKTAPVRSNDDARRLGMTCPQCGSDDTAKLQVVYLKGASRTKLSGLAVGMDGSLGLAGGTTSTLTGAASNASPPAKKSTRWGIYLAATCGVVLLVMVMALIAAMNDPSRRGDSFAGVIVILVILALGLLAGAALAGSALRYNQTVWVQQHAAWKRRWMCQRCGAVWTPKD